MAKDRLASICLSIAISLLGGCCSDPPCGRSGAHLGKFDGAPALSELADAGIGSKVLYLKTTEGFPIPVRVFGQEREGVPVIMLHGLQSHSGWFTQSARAIVNLGQPVYALDRHGSGLSQAARGDCDDFMDMIEEIDVVAAYAKEKHQKETIHLLGHCFGAIPAAAYACQYPGQLASLILSTPGIHTLTSVTPFQAIQIAISSLFGGKACIPVPLQTEMFSDLKRYQEFKRTDPLSLTHATASLYVQVPRARRFIQRHVLDLTMPVFMAIAGNDTICDNEENQLFFEAIPSGRKRLVEYGLARHILEFSRDKKLFFADLKEWLSAAN